MKMRWPRLRLLLVMLAGVALTYLAALLGLLVAHWDLFFFIFFTLATVELITVLMSPVNAAVFELGRKWARQASTRRKEP
jgi:hypothetical protein